MNDSIKIDHALESALKQRAMMADMGLLKDCVEGVRSERAAQVREPRYVRYVECAKAQLGIASRLVEVAPVFGYGCAREEAVDLALKNAQMAVESIVLLKAEFERGE